MTKPKTKKRWKPSVGDIYFSFDIEGSITETIMENRSYICFHHENACIDFLGAYRTRKEAEAMRKKLKAFIIKEIGK